MTEGLRDLINSAGIIAESCKLRYDAFLNAGFTEAQSMFLVGKMLSTEMQIASTSMDDEEET